MGIKAKNQDVIIYQVGKSISLDKKDAETNNQLSQFYANKYTIVDTVKVVINPRDILESIKIKLSPTELFVLNNLVNISK